jgi:hypothetical protein
MFLSLAMCVCAYTALRNTLYDLGSRRFSPPLHTRIYTPGWSNGQQVLDDAVHVVLMVSITAVAPSLALPALQAYLVTDIFFHTAVFMRCRAYLMHHYITMLLCGVGMLKVQHGSLPSNDAALVVCIFECGLLGIIALDLFRHIVLYTMSPRRQLFRYASIERFLLFLRPIVYIVTRSIGAAVIISRGIVHSWVDCVLILPLLSHNTRVLWKQVKAARAAW